jgi:light-regulated signal transduction histidine kinase (bacteriophytochrome)
MTEPDLLGCADEPIRIPGAVQPHGALLAADGRGVVVLHSANAADVLGRPVAGIRIGDLLDLAAVEPGLPLRTSLGGRAFEVAVHRTTACWSRSGSRSRTRTRPGEVWHRRLPLVLQRLQEAPDLGALCDALAARCAASPASTA